jgi:hypothetical protein
MAADGAAVGPSSAGAVSVFALGAAESDEVLDVDEELLVLADASELSAAGRAG